MSRTRKSSTPEPSPSFTWGNIVNLGGLALIIPVLTVAGGYAILGDSVKRHDESIKNIISARDDERRSRESVRNEFIESQRKLVDVLNRLDTRLSVSEKQLEKADRQLEKINDQLMQQQPTRGGKAPAR